MIELEEFLLDANKLEDIFRDYERERREEAYRELTEWRRKNSNFMERPLAIVLAPRCQNCYGEKMRDNENWEPPHITSIFWKRNLRKFGLATDEIREIRRRDSVRCHVCRCRLEYGEDSFYVDRVPFEYYFANEILEATRGRKPPRWMKRLVFETFEATCFGCGTKLTWEEPETKEIDHIRPHTKGGETDIFNLQLLCRNGKNRCSEIKGDKQPRESSQIYVVRSELFPSPYG